MTEVKKYTVYGKRFQFICVDLKIIINFATKSNSELITDLQPRGNSK